MTAIYYPTPEEQEEALRDAEEGMRELIAHGYTPEMAPEEHWEFHDNAHKALAEMQDREMASSKVIDPFKCLHARTEIREWVYSNGSVHYRRQCLTCFMAVGNELKHAVALRELGGRRPSTFDTQARDIALHRYLDLARREKDSERREWWRQYNEYLKTEAWARKRRLVIERCGNLCEGCRQAPVVEVHHLTYAHVGNELLYELVGLCLRCHGIAHDEDPAG